MGGEVERLRETLEVMPVWKVPAAEEAGSRWLIEGIWSEEAVGVVGGAPKCAKTWLSLEMALSVASGAPCLGVFRVERPGPVLVLSAEDAPRQVRERMEGLAVVRGIKFETLDVGLILSTRLRLEDAVDRKRFEDVLDRHRPRLLVLDPFIRLHGVDENSASEISGVLAKLREWQRKFHVAILVVHHTRKVSGVSAGQALRGSSDFHAWGDSNLYLKRKDDGIVMTIEHRSAASGEPVRLQLKTEGCAPHLAVSDEVACVIESRAASPAPEIEKKIIGLLARAEEPHQQEQIRAALKIRNQHLSDTLKKLHAEGKLIRHEGRWSLVRVEAAPNPA